MTEHTPGPWTISESKRHPIIYIFGDGKQIASTYGEGDYYFTQKLNAHLIAAAPDLLDALECIVANGIVGPDSAMSDLADCYHVPLDDIEAARAAIAKARGEEQE